VTCIALLAAGCAVDVERGLDDADANRALRELSRAGISAEKAGDDSGTFRILVPRASLNNAATVLAAHDLPRRARPLPSMPLLPTPADERARFAAATALDLERSLEAIPGVLSAHVQLALPSEDALDPLAPAGTHATAAVLLKGEPGATLPGDAELKALVAAAVPRLQAGDVQLVHTVAKPLPPPISLTRVGPLELAPESRPVALALALAAALAILTLAALLGSAALRLRQLRRGRAV
jgi:type III secretion system YscJ/HrcJ family lipoprotein